MNRTAIAITLIAAAMSTAAHARGHRGGHSHRSYSYHAAPKPRSSIAHHAAKAAAGTAASTAVRRVMKPKPANQPRSSYTPQPMPPMPANIQQCNQWAGTDNAMFNRCQQMNGR